MPELPQLWPYTPSREAPDRLVRRTVGNEAERAAIHQRLATAAAGGPVVHTLLLGPPGSGKSHLLAAVTEQARNDPELAGRLAFARLDEDAIGITRAADLEAVLGARPPGRLLVLQIENLDRVAHALREAGQREVRNLLDRSGSVLVLASAAQPMPVISEPAGPWSGLFSTTQLAELDLDQRQALLIELAGHSPDRRLADFLSTGAGRSRLRALAVLVGGLPRAWTILAECLTVELLDPLLPAVEALLERLVPYHQQLLWNLSPVEQRLVLALADGPSEAGTVAELAELAGVSQRVAGTTLGRLADSWIVRADKLATLDQRLTWYRLREPLLGHHLQYRSAREQPLPLLVQLVKAWFETEHETEHETGHAAGPLAASDAATVQAWLVEAAQQAVGSPFDVAALQRDPQAVLASVRFWEQAGPEPAPVAGGQASALVELMLLALRHDWRGAVELVDRGRLEPQLLGLGRTLVTSAHDQDSAVPVADRFELLLVPAVELAAGDTRTMLELVAACWAGRLDPQRAEQRLASLARSGSDRLGLDLQRALAFWAGRAGDPAAARDQFRQLALDSPGPSGSAAESIARCGQALWTGEAGDPARAVELAAQLLSVTDPALRSILDGPARQVLQANLRRLLNAVAVGQQPAQPGLTGLLVAALAGSARAQVQLPVALAPIVAGGAAGAHP